MSYPNPQPWSPDDLELIRRENLQQLVEEHGGTDLLAQRTQMLELVLENYLAPPDRQMAGLRGPLSARAVEQIELLTDSPPGWLSVKRPEDDKSNRWRPFFARATGLAGMEGLLSEQDVSMSLAHTLRSWGATVSVQARTLRLGQDFQLQWAFAERPGHRDKAISLLIRIECALIGCGEIVLTSQGRGVDEAAAARDALSNVARTPLAMLVRALAGQRTASPLERPGWRVETATGAWAISHHVWPPQPASLLETFESLAAELSESLLGDSSLQAYWLQTSVVVHEGLASHTGIRRRGIAWPQGHRTLIRRAWPSDLRYQGVEQFVLALPA